MQRPPEEPSAREALDGEHSIVLFDGVCNLCNGFVQFVIERDPDDTFRFASLQSDVGQSILEAVDAPGDTLDSVVLVEDGDCYTASSAAIRILRRFGGPYRLSTAFLLVPPFVRDRVYRFVADNRYAWFGKKEHCMMPSPETRAKFLAVDDRPTGDEKA